MAFITLLKITEFGSDARYINLSIFHKWLCDNKVKVIWKEWDDVINARFIFDNHIISFSQQDHEIGQNSLNVAIWPIHYDKNNEVIHGEIIRCKNVGLTSLLKVLRSWKIE